jgi:ABC-type transport system involved in multi-copper enzyme maturation permease subunit
MTAAATDTDYRSTIPAGRDGFGAMLRAEWTKFHTVRAWVVGMVAAVLVTIGLCAVAAAGVHTAVRGPNGPITGPAPARPAVPVGPGGEAVSDGFVFVNQTLDGDGTITARITSMTGALLTPGQGGPEAPGVAQPAAVMPWAKAGVIVKDSTKAGSAYAAAMLTGSHGVRMQYDFTGDIAGRVRAAKGVSTSSPQWLRLTRTGSKVIAYESADGVTWTRIGSTVLPRLHQSVDVGLFVASPPLRIVHQHVGGSNGSDEPTQATVAFDNVTIDGSASGTWTTTKVGGDETPGDGRATATASGYTLIGSGEIAPFVDGDLGVFSLERSVIGAFAGITVIIIVAVLFITAEYRRWMIRTTVIASPRRARMLAAKAIVVGGVTFVAGLIAVGVALPLSRHILTSGGNRVEPAPWPAIMQVTVGTAALMAVAAVFALGLGALFKRSVGAVAAGIVLVVVPYILATAAILPVTAADWVLRISPAAAFAVQQTIPAYQQVDGYYTPEMGFYPLAPWVGFAVLCAWAAAALGLAAYRLRRSDV